MTDLKFLYDYLFKEYGLEFEFVYYGAVKCLQYQKGKQEYSLHYDYALQPKIDNKKHWSLFTSYMNRKKWYGNGGAYIDEGTKTIDKVMNEWGFKKQNQTTIFDFMGSV